MSIKHKIYLFIFQVMIDFRDFVFVWAVHMQMTGDVNMIKNRTKNKKGD